MASDHKNNQFYLKYIVLAISIFAFFTLIFWHAPTEILARVGSYMQVVTLIILTITGLISLQSFKHQKDDRRRIIGMQYANISQSKIGDVDKMFMSNPLLDRLYCQMYSHDPHVQKILKMIESKGGFKESVEMLKYEHQASNLIFQKIADIYECESFDEISEGCIEWINTFRGWMKSPILQSHWKYLKYEQDPEVRQFIDKYLIQNNKFIKK